MLQIRLSKPANETGGSAKPVPMDTVTVACPDHLVLAELPVAKSLGSASATAIIKNVGRRSRRQLCERVHFCLQCDFPIAIYGRLSPCEHVFCLECARSDSLCYLCDERIQKIQTIKMMEGIYICAAPRCYKSFLKQTDFVSHINETHVDLLHPDKIKEVNEAEAINARKISASESTVQAPLRPVFSPSSNSQVNDSELKTKFSQSREQTPSRPVMHSWPIPHFPVQVPNHSSEQQPDGESSQSRYPQQAFDHQGLGPRQDSVNSNQVLAPPQFGQTPYTSEAPPQFYGAPYDISRSDSTPAARTEQGSLIGFSPGPINFPQNYSRPWNMALGSVPLEPPMVPQGRGFSQGEYGQNTGFFPSNLPPPAANKGMEPQALPPPPPQHMSQTNRGRPYSGDGNHDAPPGFGWQTQ